MEIGIIILGILLLAVRIVFRTRMMDEMRRSQSNRYLQPTYPRPSPKSKVSPQQAMLDRATTAIHQNPRDASAYADHGAALILLKRYVEALTDLNHALEIQADCADAFNNRAVVHYRQNNLELALSDFNAAIRYEPNAAHMYLNRAMVYKKLENNVKAEVDIESALDLNLKLVDAADKANNKYHVLDDNIIWNRQLSRAVFDKTELLFVQYEHHEYLAS